MSRNILRSALLVAIVMIALSGITLAQGWGGAATNMTANAEVYTVLSITPDATLNFGDLLSTQASPSIDPILGTNDANVGQHTSNTAHAAGKFHIAGTASKSIHITYPATAPLSNGTQTITWTLAVSGATADAGARGGASYTSGAAATMSAGGNYYLWVGGSLPALSSQASGAYSGTASFVVDYN